MSRMDIAFQNELTMEENIELLEKLVMEEMVPIGMIVDVAIHNPDKGKRGIPNPHGHLSASMRPFLESGEWGIKQHTEYVLDENGESIRKPNGKYKTIAVSETGWNDPALLEHWRERWAEIKQEHRKELNQYHKAKRKLEPYLVEGSTDAERAVWEEKIEAIEADITQKSEDADLTALKDELEILKYIKDSIDYCINPSGGSGGEGGNSGGSGQPIKPDKDAEAEKQKKQAEEQAQAEAQRQQAEQLSRQTHQTSQEEKKSERISLKERIRDKQEIVREYDRTHQHAIQNNKRKRDATWKFSFMIIAVILFFRNLW